MTPKTEDTTRTEAVNANPPLNIHEKQLSSDSPMTSKPLQGDAVSTRLPIPFANVPKMDKPKQEKAKRSPSSNPNDAVPIDALLKKKVKRKPNAEMVEEKVAVPQSEERQKNHKNVTAPLPKSNLQPAAASGSENPS